MKIAILDLGTNTFHLLIAEVYPSGEWKKVFKERVTVKLGRNGINKHVIAAPAYRRGMNALKKFHNAITELNVKKVFTYGTAALRSASNGKQFLEEAFKKYRFKIQLISGDEEALFIYKGVRQAVPIGNKKALIVDIGGGSVEMLIADSKKIFWKKSYKSGAALLLDKFKPSDPLTRNDLRNLQSFFEVTLHSMVEACRIHRPAQLIGSAGSFETFASMIRHQFPLSGSHYGKTWHPIEVKNFKMIHRQLVVSNATTRNRMKGLIKMRVDMIVMASLLLNFVLQKSHINSIKLSTYSLKEGALWTVIHSKK